MASRYRTSNFPGNPDVLLWILVVSLFGQAILMVIAGQLGKCSIAGERENKG